MFRSKLALGPLLCVVVQPLRGPAFRIPGEAQEELRRELHRFKIAHVNDPNAVGAVAIGQIHLLLDFCDGDSVQPFVGTRAANIIEVIIHTGAARSFPFFSRGQPPNIPPIIVAP